MKTSFRFAALSLALLAGSLSRPARAADGRIPISSVPFTISSPGSYYVTRDLSLAAGNMITISAGDVNLDLMNHTLTHTGSASGNSVVYLSDAYSNIRITGGRITGGYAGVILAGTAPNSFYQVDHLIITGPAYAGIFMAPGFPARAVIKDNVISAVTGSGMFLLNIENGRIERNDISHCTNFTSIGIGLKLINSNYNRISDNVISAIQTDGINITGSSQNSLDGNSVVNNNGNGFNLGSGSLNVYANNRLMGNASGNIFTAGISAGGNNAGAGNF